MPSMPKIRTTDGYLIDWDRKKIAKSLERETRLAEKFFDVSPISQSVSLTIAEETEKRIRKMDPIFASSSMVREIVNNILLEWGTKEPRYNIYRNVMTRVGTPVYDAYLIDTGLGFEKNENANLMVNPETSHKKKADLLSKEEYLLLFPIDIADAHHRGDIHIHDLEYFGTRPFCQDWDLRYFFKYGFLPDGNGFHTAVAAPAKKPEVALLHSVKALAAGQTNFAGGQGFMYYTMFMAPYLEGLSDKQIEQIAQMMFYELGQMHVARGGQMIFSNIQLPPGVPDIWKDVKIVKNGKVGPGTYSDYELETQNFFKAIMEVALKGDYWGKPFNFPKLECHISPEFYTKEYDDLWYLAHQVVSKHGSPYFDNMLPDYRGYGDGIGCYQCCAFNFVNSPHTDPLFDKKLNFEDGMHFSMGGWQVVSINMPRLAYRANGDYDKLLESAKQCMRYAIEVFKVKQKWMNNAINNNLLPFALQTPGGAPTLVDFSELVYIIGVVGINEMVQYFTGEQLHESDDALRLAIKLLLDMERYRAGLEMRYGMTLALARTPAESTAQTFAVKDLVSEYKHMAEKTVKGDLSFIPNLDGSKDIPIYYTNGTHINVSSQVPLGRKIDIEHKFFPILSGGNIFHVWLGESAPSPDAIMKLTERIATKSQIGYFAYTKDLTVCASCNSTSSGLHDKCPMCSSDNVTWWSRITGYYTDVSGWNAAKKQELKDRYKIGL